MDQIKQFSSEEELYQYIDEYYKEKEIKLEAYRILNDDEDNETVGCTQGCPQQYIDDSDIFVVCWNDEYILRDYFKQELLQAFLKANNHRLISAIERKKEIDGAGFFDKKPEKISFVDEKPLTRDEILAFIDGDFKSNKLFNIMLNEMVERLEKMVAGYDDNSVGFWATIAEHYLNEMIEAGSLTIAVVESTVKGTANVMKEGLMGAFATVHGVRVGLWNMDVDMGVDAAIQGNKDLKIYFPDSEVSNFSQKQIQKNAFLQGISNNINNIFESLYDYLEQTHGKNTAEFVQGLLETIGKITVIYGSGSMAKTVVSSAKGSKSLLKIPPKETFAVTSNMDAINATQKYFGNTEGTAYSMGVKDAPRWRSGQKKISDPHTIHFIEEAAALFNKHEVWGPFSGLKRILGQYKASFGDIKFLESSYNPKTKVLTVSRAIIVPHSPRNVLIYIKAGGFPLTGRQYAAFALSKLWGRRSLDLIFDSMIISPLLYKDKKES